MTKTQKRKPDGAPAYRDSKKPGPNDANVQIRPAGPEGMSAATGAFVCMQLLQVDQALRR